MRKFIICFFILVGMVTAQAQDMDAMKYFNLGLASSATSKKIKYFTQALQLDPVLVEAYEKRGLLYYFQEKYDKVIQDFQRYVELAPAQSDGYRMLGMGFLKSGVYQAAVYNFTRTINMEPDIACAYANRAEAYRLIGEYEEAIRDSTRAIEIWGDPRTMSDAYRTRTKAYLATGRNTEAYADNLKIASLDPSIPRTWGKNQPVGPMGVMSLFILNAIVFLFVFEVKHNPLKLDRFRSINMLNSKLLAPQTIATINRKSLYPLFSEIPKKRATTVIAGAGYGKTTLIGQAAGRLNLNTVWYRLDASDGDLTIFLSYLTAGIQKYFPGFGVETCRHLKKIQILNRRPEDVLAIFLKELESSVKKDLFLVLDDYHTIQYSREIKSALEFLLAHFPPEVHVILISRFDIDLPLSRLRAARDVVDITKEDLAFTPDETGQLYSGLFDIFLKQESLEILHQKTEGWISGLILFYHALRGKKPAEVDKLLSKLEGSQKLILNYLEENIYDSLPDEKKEFLLKTSIFPRLNTEFCDQFLKIANSREILKELEANHLFTSSFDDEDGWYVYHQLFRDFLLEKLKTALGYQAVLELYRDAAELLENSGEDEEALRYYLNTEAFSEGCGLLGKNGPEAGGVRKLLPVPDDLMISDAFIDNQNAPPKSQAPCLKVYLFGKFRVFQGDQEVPDKRWKSKKAQMIFKYLLFMRCRGYLKKEVLMELLWPEDDPVRTAKRFHVALASLRKTLEPEIARGTPSAYISRSGDGYSIDIGDTGTLDIEEFNAELKLAGAENNPEISIGHYLRAILMYQGDFLEEDLYIPWCDEERERFKEEYLSVLAKIIQFYEHLKDYPTCIDYAGKYLKADKYAENIYQQLMHYYAFIGNKAMMIRMFDRCKENMTNELDVPLSRETEAIYQKLMAS